MRFLADECVLGAIVRQLQSDGHDVVRVPKSLEGANDDRILAHSVSDDRIVLTQDYHFGDLAVRWRKPAIGIVIVAEVSFRGTLEEIATQVAKRLAQLERALIGKLTVLEGERTRQRELIAAVDKEGL